MFAGAFMMGAKDRLLPPSVPYRFFVTAIVMHVAGWAVLLAGAEDVPGFMGGTGPALAGLHLITLGVLAMTAIGAAFQMLPVATRRQLGPVWACRLTWWLFAPGVAVLGAGMALSLTWALAAGAALTVAGLALFGILVGACLLRTNDLPAVTSHVWMSLLSLAALALLGLGLVIDFETGFLPDRPSVAAAHAVLGGYGFMGMLVMGFTYVLVPMFVLSPGVPDATGVLTATLSGLALAAGAGGTLAGLPWAVGMGIVLGGVAVWLHVRALLAVLRARMRRKLEPFFRLIKGAWVMLPVSLLLGLPAAVGERPGIAVPLWGFVLVFGWLLTFATGILQRIMPFLASMHSGARGGKPVLVSHLTAPAPLVVHALAHTTALVLVAAGLIGLDGRLVQAGAAAGLAGSVAFAVFAIVMMRRYFAHECQQQREGTREC